MPKGKVSKSTNRLSRLRNRILEDTAFLEFSELTREDVLQWPNLAICNLGSKCIRQLFLDEKIALDTAMNLSYGELSILKDIAFLKFLEETESLTVNDVLQWSVESKVSLEKDHIRQLVLSGKLTLADAKQLNYSQICLLGDAEFLKFLKAQNLTMHDMLGWPEKELRRLKHHKIRQLVLDGKITLYVAGQLPGLYRHMEYIPTKKRVVVTDKKNSVKVFDATDGRLIYTFSQDRYITAILGLSNGYIAIASDPFIPSYDYFFFSSLLLTEIQVFNPENGTLVKKFPQKNQITSSEGLNNALEKIKMGSLAMLAQLIAQGCRSKDSFFTHMPLDLCIFMTAFLFDPVFMDEKEASKKARKQFRFFQDNLYSIGVDNNVPKVISVYQS